MNDSTRWNSGKTADKLDAQFHILTLKTFLFLRRFWSRFGFTVLILSPWCLRAEAEAENHWIALFIVYVFHTTTFFQLGVYNESTTELSK